jgi:hypothetical protein
MASVASAIPPFDHSLCFSVTAARLVSLPCLSTLSIINLFKNSRYLIIILIYIKHEIKALFAEYLCCYSSPRSGVEIACEKAEEVSLRTARTLLVSLYGLQHESVVSCSDAGLPLPALNYEI